MIGKSGDGTTLANTSSLPKTSGFKLVNKEIESIFQSKLKQQMTAQKNRRDTQRLNFLKKYDLEKLIRTAAEAHSEHSSESDSDSVS